LPGEGFEPPTFGLQNRCTAAVLTRLSADPFNSPAGRFRQAFGLCSGGWLFACPAKLVHRVLGERFVRLDVDPHDLAREMAGDCPDLVVGAAGPAEVRGACLSPAQSKAG
jgi:hypothetical protein